MSSPGHRGHGIEIAPVFDSVSCGAKLVERLDALSRRTCKLARFMTGAGWQPRLDCARRGGACIYLYERQLNQTVAACESMEAGDLSPAVRASLAGRRQDHVPAHPRESLDRPQTA